MQKFSYYFVVLFLGFFTATAFAAVNLTSLIPSSVPNIRIPNTHLVDSPNNNVVRGMAPSSPEEFDDLYRYGITDVLIFKGDDGFGNIAQEVKTLLDHRLPEITFTRIPFLWNTYPNFAEPCGQTISALKLLHDASVLPNKKIFFHCTVGEDRTGYLAALFRLLEKPTLDLKDLFFSEMCENGYEAGDGHKDMAAVVMPIRKWITPLFLKMAYKIKNGEIHADHLDAATCQKDPENEQEFLADPGFKSDYYTCSPSTKVKW